MSNSNNKEMTKVIELRPFHEFKRKEQDKEDNSLVEKASIQLEVENAKKELQSVEQQRQNLLVNLQQELAEEREQWEKTKTLEMERVKKEAFDSGYDEGKTESIQEYRHLIEQANSLVENATEEYYEKVKQQESTIIYLAIQIAEKILQNKLSENPAVFVPIVQAVIQDLKDSYTYSIYLHPENYSSVLKQKDELYETVDEKVTISLYIDDELQKNSCIIEHDTGRVDASVDTQLNEIKQTLTQLMENSE